MNTIQSKNSVRFKYNIGDIIEGELNIFYVQKQIVAERVVDCEIEYSSYGTLPVLGKDWKPVPEYILENLTLQQNFRYGEKHIDNMIRKGAKLYRKIPPKPTHNL